MNGINVKCVFRVPAWFWKTKVFDVTLTHKKKRNIKQTPVSGGSSVTTPQVTCIHVKKPFTCRCIVGVELPILYVLRASVCGPRLSLVEQIVKRTIRQHRPQIAEHVLYPETRKSHLWRNYSDIARCCKSFDGLHCWLAPSYRKE